MTLALTIRNQSDLTPLVDYLSSASKSGTAPDQIKLTYLKLTVNGPRLALFEVPSPTGTNSVVVARWIAGEKGERWAESINSRYSASAVGDSVVLPRAAVYEPRLGVLFTEFPYDRRLQTLPSAMDPKVLFARLRPSLERSYDARLESITPVLVRYRPEGKCVVRLDLTWDQHGAQAPKSVFGKISKQSIFQRSHERLTLLAEAIGGDGFVVPTPIATIEDLSLEVFSAIDGTPMSHQLTQPEACGIGARVGTALRRFHATEVNLPHFASTDRASLLTDNAAQLAQHMPELETTINDLCTEIAGRLLSHLHTSAQLCHHDFHPANVIVGSRSLGLIDFEDTSLGDPADDVGSMVAHLQAEALEQPALASHIRDELSKFLDAYDIGEMANRVRTYAALHSVLLAYQVFRYPAPSTTERAQSLLHQAQHITSGKRL